MKKRFFHENLSGKTKFDQIIFITNSVYGKFLEFVNHPKVKILCIEDVTFGNLDWKIKQHKKLEKGKTLWAFVTGIFSIAEAFEIMECDPSCPPLLQLSPLDDCRNGLQSDIIVQNLVSLATETERLMNLAMTNGCCSLIFPLIPCKLMSAQSLDHFQKHALESIHGIIYCVDEFWSAPILYLYNEFCNHLLQLSIQNLQHQSVSNKKLVTYSSLTGGVFAEYYTSLNQTQTNILAIWQRLVQVFSENILKEARPYSDIAHPLQIIHHSSTITSALHTKFDHIVFIGANNVCQAINNRIQIGVSFIEMDPFKITSNFADVLSDFTENTLFVILIDVTIIADKVLKECKPHLIMKNIASFGLGSNLDLVGNAVEFVKDLQNMLKSFVHKSCSVIFSPIYPETGFIVAKGNYSLVYNSKWCDALILDGFYKDWIQTLGYLKCCWKTLIIDVLRMENLSTKLFGDYIEKNYFILKICNPEKCIIEKNNLKEVWLSCIEKMYNTLFDAQSYKKETNCFSSAVKSDLNHSLEDLRVAINEAKQQRKIEHSDDSLVITIHKENEVSSLIKETHAPQEETDSCSANLKIENIGETDKKNKKEPRDKADHQLPHSCSHFHDSLEFEFLKDKKQECVEDIFPSKLMKQKHVDDISAAKILRQEQSVRTKFKLIEGNFNKKDLRRNATCRIGWQEITNDTNFSKILNLDLTKLLTKFKANYPRPRMLSQFHCFSTFRATQFFLNNFPDYNFILKFSHKFTVKKESYSVRNHNLKRNINKFTILCTKLFEDKTSQIQAIMKTINGQNKGKISCFTPAMRKNLFDVHILSQETTIKNCVETNNLAQIKNSNDSEHEAVKSLKSSSEVTSNTFKEDSGISRNYNLQKDVTSKIKMMSSTERINHHINGDAPIINKDFHIRTSKLLQLQPVSKKEKLISQNYELKRSVNEDLEQNIKSRNKVIVTVSNIPSTFCDKFIKDMAISCNGKEELLKGGGYSLSFADKAKARTLVEVLRAKRIYNSTLKVTCSDGTVFSKKVPSLPSLRDCLLEILAAHTNAFISTLQTKFLQGTQDSFYHVSWKDVFVVGLEKSLVYLIGAIRATYRLPFPRGPTILFVTPSLDFVDLALKVVSPVAEKHKLVVHAVTNEAKNYSSLSNFGLCHVLLGTPTSLWTMLCERLPDSCKALRTLIIDDISSLLSSPIFYLKLSGLIETIYSKTTNFDTLCKVVVADEADGIILKSSKMLKSNLTLVKGSTDIKQKGRDCDCSHLTVPKKKPLISSPLDGPDFKTSIFRRPQRVLEPKCVERPPVDKGKAWKDLDNPIEQNKNPWGFLAQNWGKKETQSALNYQELLRQHVTVSMKREIPSRLVSSSRKKRRSGNKRASLTTDAKRTKLDSSLNSTPELTVSKRDPLPKNSYPIQPILPLAAPSFVESTLHSNTSVTKLQGSTLAKKLIPIRPKATLGLNESSFVATSSEYPCKPAANCAFDGNPTFDNEVIETPLGNTGSDLSHKKSSNTEKAIDEFLASVRSETARTANLECLSRTPTTTRFVIIESESSEDSCEENLSVDMNSSHLCPATSAIPSSFPVRTSDSVIPENKSSKKGSEKTVKVDKNFGNVCPATSAIPSSSFPVRTSDLVISESKLNKHGSEGNVCVNMNSSNLCPPISSIVSPFRCRANELITLKNESYNNVSEKNVNDNMNSPAVNSTQLDSTNLLKTKNKNVLSTLTLKQTKENESRQLPCISSSKKTSFSPISHSSPKNLSLKKTLGNLKNFNCIVPVDVIQNKSEKENVSLSSNKDTFTGNSKLRIPKGCPATQECAHNIKNVSEIENSTLEQNQDSYRNHLEKLFPKSQLNSSEIKVESAVLCLEGIMNHLPHLSKGFYHIISNFDYNLSFIDNLKIVLKNEDNVLLFLIIKDGLEFLNTKVQDPLAKQNFEEGISACERILRLGKV